MPSEKKSARVFFWGFDVQQLGLVCWLCPPTSHQAVISCSVWAKIRRCKFVRHIADKDIASAPNKALSNRKGDIFGGKWAGTIRAFDGDFVIAEILIVKKSEARPTASFWLSVSRALAVKSR